MVLNVYFKTMENTLYYLYIFGSIPLLLILMYSIGKVTPTEIIQDTVDSYPFEEKLHQATYQQTLRLTICLSILGVFLGLYYAINNSQNLNGFSLLSLSIMFYGFLLTAQQVQGQTKFTKELLKLIKLNINYSTFIKNRDKIETTLYISRILLLIGLEIIALGCIWFCWDNPYFDLVSLQLRYLVVIGIGYAMMNFAWGMERIAVNSIIQPQILAKLNTCNK